MVEDVPLYQGARLTLHDLDVLLQGHLVCFQQALDGKAAALRCGLPDGKATLRRITHQSNGLASQLLREGVGL
jgi:hypothetical protein